MLEEVVPTSLLEVSELQLVSTERYEPAGVQGNSRLSFFSKKYLFNLRNESKQLVFE